MTEPVLSVEGLTITYPGYDAEVVALRNITLTLGRERLGIVGESGSGKSTLGRAIMGLIRPPARLKAARMRLHDLDLLTLTERQWAKIRGRRIAMVFQDPRYSLNPVMTVGAQIIESYRAHISQDGAVASRAAHDMLTAVKIHEPDKVMELYPHQLSGGMGQRVMIAMMLVCQPEVLIADEPTSALDVTVQRSVLAILDEAIRRSGMSLILISHNLPLVATYCDRILVMYGGRIVEECAAADLAGARHPYTRGLIAALPDLQNPRIKLPQLQRDPEWLRP